MGPNDARKHRDVELAVLLGQDDQRILRKTLQQIAQPAAFLFCSRILPTQGISAALKTGVQTTCRFQRFLTEYALLFSFLPAERCPVFPCHRLGPSRISASSMPEEFWINFTVSLLKYCIERFIINLFFGQKRKKRLPAKRRLANHAGKRGRQVWPISQNTASRP
jgi:hypothetical protein